MMRGVLGFSWSQAAIVGAVVLLQILDGYDLLAMSFAASSVAAEWKLSPAVLGTVFSAALFGSFVAALSLSALLSLFDRKRLLLFALGFTGIGSLLAALAPDVATLFAGRFITGLGLGAISPLAIGYAATFAPPHRRGAAVALSIGAISLGSVVGSVVSAGFIPAWGWRSLFHLGVAAAVLALPLALALPAWPGDPDQAERPRRLRFFPLAEVLSPAWRSVFLGIIVATLSASLANYFVATWLPILIERSGLTLRMASFAAGGLYTGALVGTLLIGGLMDRLRPAAVLTCAFLVGALILILLALAPSVPLLVLLLCIALGLFANAAVSSISTFTALLFPADLRVEVIAGVIAVGRAAGLVAPLGAGLLLGAGATPAQLFLLAGLLNIVAATGIGATWLSRRRTVVAA